jgi:hypothetical protein
MGILLGNQEVYLPVWLEEGAQKMCPFQVELGKVLGGAKERKTTVL